MAGSILPIVVATAAVIFFLLLAIYIYYPPALDYIPEVKKLREKTVELTNLLTKSKTDLDVSSKDLIKANSNLVNAMKELEESKAKYKKLDESVVKMIDAELSYSNRIFVASVQNIVNVNANMSPEVKDAFTKLYMSILDMGFVLKGDFLCKNKERIMPEILKIINNIKNNETAQGVSICDITRLKDNFDILKRNMLYRPITQCSAVKCEIVKYEPLYPDTILTSMENVIDNAYLYSKAVLAVLCRDGKFDVESAKTELKKYLDALNC